MHKSKQSSLNNKCLLRHCYLTVYSSCSKHYNASSILIVSYRKRFVMLNYRWTNCVQWRDGLYLKLHEKPSFTGWAVFLYITCRTSGITCVCRRWDRELSYVNFFFIRANCINKQLQYYWWYHTIILWILEVIYITTFFGSQLQAGHKKLTWFVELCARTWCVFMYVCPLLTSWVLKFDM